MKAEDIKLDELVDFKDGSINLHGRRLLLHSLEAFAQLRKDLIEMVGPEHARRIYTRFGYFWGQADAAGLKRIFQWETAAEWVRAGVRLHALQGVAKIAVKTLRAAPGQPFYMEVVWHDSAEAEEHLLATGSSKAPACWIVTGYASGYASFCLGRDIYFIENKCRCKGDRVCAALGQERTAWGSELAAHLPFYQAFDIQGKVMELTRELKQKTLELARQRSRLEQLSGEAEAVPVVEARSAAFRRVLELSERVAPYDSSVLITGESGVGKEVLARRIHQFSPRAGRPMLAINCGALPETLLESELFGHTAGAFTGATRERVGLFEQAHRGTLFLDEIGDISPAMQVKLLRVLQAREIMRVGESKTRLVDVRILAATNRNLDEAIRAGKFREDLFYRLRVIEIAVPPLRERHEDILPLARYFVRQFAKRLKLPALRLDAATLDYLLAYSWPGNVRELENAIERAAILSKDGLILPESLSPNILHGGAPAAGAAPVARPLAQVELEHIQAVLKLAEGNRTRAAQILGISAPTLWRKLKET